MCNWLNLKRKRAIFAQLSIGNQSASENKFGSDSFNSSQKIWGRFWIHILIFVMIVCISFQSTNQLPNSLHSINIRLFYLLFCCCDIQYEQSDYPKSISPINERSLSCLSLSSHDNLYLGYLHWYHLCHMGAAINTLLHNSLQTILHTNHFRLGYILFCTLQFFSLDMNKWSFSLDNDQQNRTHPIQPTFRSMALIFINHYFLLLFPFERIYPQNRTSRE